MCIHMLKRPGFEACGLGCSGFIFYPRPRPWWKAPGSSNAGLVSPPAQPAAPTAPSCSRRPPLHSNGAAAALAPTRPPPRLRTGYVATRASAPQAPRPPTSRPHRPALARASCAARCRTAAQTPLSTPSPAMPTCGAPSGASAALFPTCRLQRCRRCHKAAAAALRRAVPCHGPSVCVWRVTLNTSSCR
jgi:hypothetical protein